MARVNDVSARILRHNAGRTPGLLAVKYDRMARDPFAFYRATCHLFADGWRAAVRGTRLGHAPAVWSCGDLHLENFGSFKARNRLVYFDVNDFDEAALMPLSWDVVRLASSVLVGASVLEVTRAEARALAKDLVRAYASALKDGRARWVERDNATGVTRDLLDEARTRKRRVLLDRYSVVRRGRRVLRSDSEHAQAATPAETRLVRSIVREVASRERRGTFFRILGVTRRISGGGSLGLGRWMVLIEGNGAPHQHYLLDVKAAHPSVARGQSPYPQRRFPSDAERVLVLQRRAQARSPDLLHAVRRGRTSFLVRELQPSKDRLRLELCRGRLKELRVALVTMGEVAAWDALRGASRDGSASAEQLMAFAMKGEWRADVLNAAREISRRSSAAWRAFARDLRAGRLQPHEHGPPGEHRSAVVRRGGEARDITPHPVLAAV